MDALPASTHAATPEHALRPLDIHTVVGTTIKGPAFRLDAAFYRRDFADAARRATGSGLPTRKLGAMADAFVPGRTRLVTVGNPGAGAPYLRAHDAFEIRPSSGRYVARGRARDYDELLLRRGMILTPSSGRNLGPVAYVGDYLARFAMTDIMRIVPRSAEEGFYILAFLLTPTAQALLRRGRSGTSVDHLAPEDVLGVDVPWIADEAVRLRIVGDMRLAEDKLDQGRSGLDAASAKLHAEAGLFPEPPEGTYLSRSCGDAFTLQSSRVGNRLDAASHDPTVTLCAEEIGAKGGAALGDVATPVMLGRYKRYYVEPPHGRPILSGRQMVQVRPVNLKRISDRSFAEPEKFVLKPKTTIFTCDGRSEEALGDPGYVMRHWDGWMASNHVMRLEALPDIGHGYLYLAIASPWVQRQLKARASGSVIDALEPVEVSKVVIPMLPEPQRRALNAEAERCWDLISDGIVLAEKAAARFEAMLDGARAPHDA